MNRKRNKQAKGQKKDVIGIGKQEFAINQISFGGITVEFRRKSTRKRGDFFSYRVMCGSKLLAKQEVDNKKSFKFGHARSVAKAIAKLFFANLQDILNKWKIKHAKPTLTVPALLKSEHVAVA